MATPIWFSGSSPDAAFAREDQWRRERTNVLEGDRISRANAESLSMQAFLNNQQHEDRLREVDWNRNWQAQEAGSRRGEFARQFDANLKHDRDLLDYQKKADAAELKQFASDTALSGEVKAQDYFAKLPRLSDVDFDLLERTTRLPKSKLRPMAEKADAIFGENQAADLNAKFVSAQKQLISTLKVQSLTDGMLEKLRKEVEDQTAEIHPRVNFDYKENVWKFTGGGKNLIAAPGEHVSIGRPPDTATGTAPAFFAPPPPIAMPSASSAPRIPSAPSPAPGQFVMMRNPQGRMVRVPWDQVAKARALGYSQ